MPFLSVSSILFKADFYWPEEAHYSAVPYGLIMPAGSSLFLCYYIRYSKFIKEIFQELQNHLA